MFHLPPLRNLTDPIETDKVGPRVTIWSRSKQEEPQPWGKEASGTAKSLRSPSDPLLAVHRGQRIISSSSLPYSRGMMLVIRSHQTTMSHSRCFQLLPLPIQSRASSASSPDLESTQPRRIAVRSCPRLGEVSPNGWLDAASQTSRMFSMSESI